MTKKKSYQSVSLSLSLFSKHFSTKFVCEHFVKLRFIRIYYEKYVIRDLAFTVCLCNKVEIMMSCPSKNHDKKRRVMCKF